MHYMYCIMCLLYFYYLLNIILIYISEFFIYLRLMFMQVAKAAYKY